jgi:hypothetical protein
MLLEVNWLAPLPLSDGSDERLIYKCDLEDLPTEAGIYIFGRRHGRTIEALYVGRANSIRARIKSQFKNLPLMKHIENARTGTRIILIGIFIAKRGQQRAKCLPLIERSLIRYFLSETHDLVNVQGARLRHHEIEASGARGPIPELMYVDR